MAEQLPELTFNDKESLPPLTFNDAKEELPLLSFDKPQSEVEALPPLVFEGGTVPWVDGREPAEHNIPSGAGGSFGEPEESTALGKAWDLVKATGETGLALGTGMASMLATGLHGAFLLANEPGLKLRGESPIESEKAVRLEDIAKSMEGIAAKMQYEPKTELGRESTELAMAPMEWVADGAKYWGDKVLAKTGDPNLAAGVATGIEAAVYFGLPALLKQLKVRIKTRNINKKIVNDLLAEIGAESEIKKAQFEERFLEKERKAAVEPPEPKFVVDEPEAAPAKAKTTELPKLFEEGKKTSGKEPWKMTLPEIRKEYSVRRADSSATNIYRGRKYVGQVYYSDDPLKDFQYDVIKRAFRDGKVIPQEVLAAHPDFQSKGILGNESGAIELESGRQGRQKGITFYGGIPIHKAGEAFTKHIGAPLWDGLILKGIPKLLDKIPGGKALNRAFLYEYRNNLPNGEGYMKSLDDMKLYQSIGREYAVDLGKRLQSGSETSQLKMGQAITGHDVKLSPKELKLANEAKRALYDLGKQAVELGLLSEETFFKNAGRYMPRLYTSKEYKSLLSAYKLKKPTRMDLSRFKKRKDIPKEVREAMGEILTPGYPVAKGLMQLTHDIEMARFFKGIAANKDWAIVKAPVIGKNGKPVYKRYSSYHPLTGEKIDHVKLKTEFTDPIPEGFQQLPKDKRLGPLAEAYVHPEIYADLMETIKMRSKGEKTWLKALGAWKFGKVVLSPKTHARNLLSNSVLVHLGGLPMYEQPVYLTKAAYEMRGKGGYWKAAKENGLLTNTFIEAELRSLFGEATDLGGVRAGSLPEKFGKVGEAWLKAKRVAGKAAELYQAEEQRFKLAKFIHNIERRKMTPKAAAADAEKWLFNYEKVTKAQQKYRTKWYGAPFATFTLKAIPRMAEAMVKTPWRFALPGALIYGMEKVAQRMIGDSDEVVKAKKALRPEWQQGSFLGIPNFMRTWLVDDYGREYYLNLSYILPWGDLAESGGIGGIPGSLTPLSMPVTKEAWQQIGNYDSFWKEAIVKDEDLAGKSTSDKIKMQASKRAQHALQTFAPTPVIDIQKGYSKLRGRPDYRGRDRALEAVIGDVFFGIKMYPVDYADQMAKLIAKKHPRQGYLARKIAGQLKTYGVQREAVLKKGGDVSYYDALINEKIQQLERLAKELRTSGKKYRIIMDKGE